MSIKHFDGRAGSCVVLVRKLLCLIQYSYDLAAAIINPVL